MLPLAARRSARLYARWLSSLKQRSLFGSLMAAFRQQASVHALDIKEDAVLGAEQRVTKRRTNSPTIDDGHGVGKVPAQRKAVGRKAVGRKVTKPKTYPGRELEAELWEKGHRLVAGVDEAGRGPLAGPVVAAACIIPSHVSIKGIDDSKKMTATQREEAFAALMEHPDVQCSMHVVDSKQIDALNILQATMQAMAQAVERLPGPQPDFVLIDGNQQPQGIAASKSELVIKGDSQCQVVAAASILAKVTRDRLMEAYDTQYPGYGFGQHKGYGTVLHMASLKKYGPCPIHRRSYAPVAQAEQQMQRNACPKIELGAQHTSGVSVLAENREQIPKV